jgi:hypothetical protein
MASMLGLPNMPEFAQIAPRSFWVAADAHELVDGRTCMDLQLALPREQSSEERNGLGRQLMGDRFAYTLAVHNPQVKDNIDQPRTCI